MKTISRKTHAMLDYGSVILLFASPWLFNFSDVPTARTIAMVSAILILLMSLLTNYEAGIAKMVPMKAHLSADVLLGIFLAASPWLFGFSSETYLFHLLMGVVAIFAGAFTTKESYKRHYNQQSMAR